MNQFYQSQIDHLISTLLIEEEANPSASPKVSAPSCYLDTQTHELLVRRLAMGGYAVLLTTAVNSLHEILSKDHLRHAAAAVKLRRSGGNQKNIHAKIGEKELAWVDKQARLLDVKPARVLEAVLFLYARLEQ